MQHTITKAPTCSPFCPRIVSTQLITAVIEAHHKAGITFNDIRSDHTTVTVQTGSGGRLIDTRAVFTGLGSVTSNDVRVESETCHAMLTEILPGLFRRDWKQ